MKVFALFATIFLSLLLPVSGSSYVNGQSASAASAQPLRWPSQPIKIAFSRSLTEQQSNIKAGTDVVAVLRRSLRTWERVANIRFEESESPRVSVSPAGRSGDGVNLITIAATPANTLMFAKDTDEMAAATRIFFDRKGSITEADIVLNPFVQFSADGTLATYDLESTFTHELGHLLGLDHSDLVSSALYENYGQNGIYGVPNFLARSLAASDIAAIRALYGSRSPESCCGSVAGRLAASIGSSRNFEIWAEDAMTGRLAARTRVAGGGSFRLEGMPTGTYRLFAQSSLFSKTPTSAVMVGEVAVSAGEETSVAKRVSLSASDLELQIAGTNDEISGLAVPANAGQTLTLVIAGVNLKEGDMTIGSTSPFITVVPGTLTRRDYGDDIAAFSVQIKVAADAAFGEYSIFTRNRSGAISVIPGVISIGRGQ